jgi:hypothetical protein
VLALRELAVAPTTPPGAGVERGAAAVRGLLPVRDPFDRSLLLDVLRLGRDDELDEDDGADLEPDSAPPDPADDPPELDPPELEPPDDVAGRGPACAASPAGVASARPRASVRLSCVERVMMLTPLAAIRGQYP